MNRATSKEMGRLSVEERHHVITLVANGYSLSVVRRRLLEGTPISRSSGSV